MVIYPVKQTQNRSKETVLCFAYDKDLIQIYDFYCARYQNITYKEFLDLGITDIQRKLASIPENEPLFEIIKSRVININSISSKNKEERKKWRELKEANKIPDIYISNEELDININKKLGGIKDGKRFI